MAITWNDVPVVDSIQLPGSSDKYWVKDTEARQKIEDLVSATHFLGVTTTALEDESTENPIVINGEEVTAVSGDITIYKQTDHVSLEFIFDGTYWQLLGGQAIEGAGDLAYADTASTSYTPDGSVTLSTTNQGQGDTNVVTYVSRGNLEYYLESGTDIGGVYVLTRVYMSDPTESDFVRDIELSSVMTGTTVSEGSLPSLTDVTVSGVTADISGTTLVFNNATISHNFDAGAFPEYSFEEVSVISNIHYASALTSASVCGEGSQIRVNYTGNLDVSYKGISATFSGSNATITVNPD